ncbi:hypothetical protein TVAG_131170 [Trichomonas vaginalis G3]|uniref:Uncharacterized protein n=1 Tax=Trichomonas vaginalis (strain ATCC PRA-98 / G3) TaxID=412133 RepID=A2EPP0_TRIV3|nr:hypothetical protein TVAGG3_0603360 [Trichomonas vaginalis G3]EAY05383.1 hypothetical protein TVAG_131170 [Trichomonas vaginalis G3]KAI5524069.1 hypothetical protein TVAGG3_0603360 [Trichomonas vaginalis G3]|eukprot:XP_001317606.1 hypothetical protein [Trichomonas vaginalis G3]
MSSSIYLLPEFLGGGGNTLFQDAVQVSGDPIQVSGYKLFTFLRRLDNSGFSTYCVALACPGKECIMYPIQFTHGIPDFDSLGFLITPSQHGNIIHISQATFDVMDKVDKAVVIKSGDWLNDKIRFHQIAAMHYLGVVPNLSPASFYQNDMMKSWENKLHQIYGTYGDLNNALIAIFKRVSYSLNFFCISLGIQVLGNIVLDHQFCFGALYEPLLKSHEIIFIRNTVPGTIEAESPFTVLYNALRITRECFNNLNFSVASLDDQNGYNNAVQRFQESVKIQVGCCDIKTLRKLMITSNMQKLEQLPIFKMAGININIIHEPDFPIIQPISRQEQDPLAEQVRNEINSAINGLPDPATKIEWLNSRIEGMCNECNDRCLDMSARVDLIENRIADMSRQLKDIVEESKIAAKRVETAATTLDNVYNAHNKIQSKFDILREKLFTEQRNTRVTLIIGVILTLLGALILRI